jgi:calcineurin-like phosphoesterase family protein
MALWFTADTHFGHSNIIRYCKRPFANVDQMDETIIKNWNDRISAKDEVWHLGDFCFDTKKLDHYLLQLNGKLNLIHGNHDRAKTRNHQRWCLSLPLKDINVENTNITLCHYGMKVWNKSNHGSLHLYGHSHSNLPGTNQCLDVGADCWEFKPVSLTEIKDRLLTLPSYRNHDMAPAIPEDS